MGSKFRHAHVRTVDAAAVADALHKLALVRKFSVADEGQSSDYDVVIATDPASPEWTSIYNPFGDFMWELSDELSTAVVELEVFDSDVFYARLSNDGCLVDVFCTDPRYVGMSARAVKGQPRRWDSLCTSGASFRDVERVFKRAAEDPERGLVELGRLIALDARSLYPDHVDPGGPKARRLRFRSPPKQRRRILRSAPSARVVTSGDFSFSKSSGPLSIVIEVESQGGGANGIEIGFGGSAMTSGLVGVEEVRYRGEAGVLTPGEGAWLVASFPTSGFPAASGVVDETRDQPEVADQRPMVRVECTANALGFGNGELELRIVPTGPAGEPCVQRFPIHVR
jgi:hypothetical protein